MIPGAQATGRLALGQIGQTPVPPAGSYAITGTAIALGVSEVASAGSYAITGNAAVLTPSILATTGSYTLTGVAVSFADSELAVAGSYTITGSDVVLDRSILADAGSYTMTLIPGQLIRTGGDYDQVYGGIGHYLEELEKRRQLEKITRKTPAPIVQQPIPFPRRLAAPPIAQQAPAIDLQAVAAQRMAGAHAQAEQAMILKRRRQAVEILLLAS